VYEKAQAPGSRTVEILRKKNLNEQPWFISYKRTKTEKKRKSRTGMQIILQHVYIFLKHQQHVDPGNHLEKLVRKQSKSPFIVKSLRKPNLLLNPI